MSDLPTDDELRRIEHLVQQYVLDQPIPVIPTEQGQAVAEIVRAVPGLLRLIATQRQAEEEA